MESEAELTLGPAAPAGPRLARQVLAEFLGTMILVAGVVGSGITAERLSPDDIGLQLLENSIATAAVLVAVILALGPVSGAHLNPLVTLASRVLGGLTTRQAATYLPAQIAGGAAGAMVANLMFGEAAVSWSAQGRGTGGHLLAEGVATFGLLLVIFGVARSGRTLAAPFAVGAYIAGAYWFTSSTGFANPAVTLARTLTDTFSGIAPASTPGFIAAQTVGAGLAIACAAVLYPTIRQVADKMVAPRKEGP